MSTTSNLRSSMKSSFGQPYSSHVIGINRGSLQKPASTAVRGSTLQPKTNNVINQQPTSKEVKEEKVAKGGPDKALKNNEKMYNLQYPQNQNSKSSISPSQSKLQTYNLNYLLSKGKDLDKSCLSQKKDEYQSGQKTNGQYISPQPKAYTPTNNKQLSGTTLQTPNVQLQQHCTINLLDITNSSASQQQTQSQIFPQNSHLCQQNQSSSNMITNSISKNSPSLISKNISQKDNSMNYLMNSKTIGTSKFLNTNSKQTDLVSTSLNKVKIDMSPFQTTSSKKKELFSTHQQQIQSSQENQKQFPSQPISQNQKQNIKLKPSSPVPVIQASLSIGQQHAVPLNDFSNKMKTSPYQNQIVVPFIKDQDINKQQEESKIQQQIGDKQDQKIQYAAALNPPQQYQFSQFPQTQNTSNFPQGFQNAQYPPQNLQINQNPQTQINQGYPNTLWNPSDYSQQQQQQLPQQQNHQEQHFQNPQYKYTDSSYTSPLEAYQFLACEEGAKRAKLTTFQQKLVTAKHDFENILSQFQQRSEISMNEYHSNISFLEQVEQEMRDQISGVTAQLKSRLLQTFNECLGSCKSGQFEVQQMLSYLNCTENDLMCNIESIIKDMDMDSLEDIVKQYETIIEQYEDTKDKTLLPMQYSSHLMKNKNNQIELFHLKDSIKSQLFQLLEMQQYTHFIIDSNSSPQSALIINNNSSNFTNNVQQQQRNVTANTPTMFQQKFNQEVNSIYVSFENKDIFNSCSISAQQQNEYEDGSKQLPPIKTYSTQPINLNLTNSQSQSTNYYQPQSPSFNNSVPLLNNPQLTLLTLKGSLSEEKIQKPDERHFTIDDTLSKINHQNNKVISMVHQASINLTDDSSNYLQSNQKRESLADHQYKLSGGSLVNPSTATNTISEATSSLAQTHSSGSRPQSEKAKGIFDYDQFDVETKPKSHFLSNQDKTEQDKFVEESQASFPLNHQYHQTKQVAGFSQITPSFQIEDQQDKILKDSNYLLMKGSISNKQKYNELLQKIQVNQSQTEKLYSDVLPTFKFSLIDTNEQKSLGQQVRQV